jgi:hypothetical protein
LDEMLKLYDIKDMKSNLKYIHLTAAAIVNILVIWRLINTAWEGNDKAIILVILGYALLFVINLIVFSILKFLRRDQAEIYRVTTLGLAILFLPVLFIAGSY